ncbi:MAG: IS110 family transposase, partial [Planctomycetota bacterium]
PSGEAALAHQLQGFGLQIEHIVYESGPTGFGLARTLERAGFKVSVIAASRIPRGYSPKAKTDRLDAVMLASYYARGLLHPIAMPTIEQEGYRALVRRRKRIAESRAKIKQKIKGFLLASGINEPASLRLWTLAASEDLTSLNIPREHRMTLASMVREYLFLLSEDKFVRAEIRAATEELYQECFDRLTSISGVGEVVATNFIAELFSPERFNRQEEVTSYLRLAPIVRQSGSGPSR